MTMKIETPVTKQFLRQYRNLSDWEKTKEATKAIREIKAIKKKVMKSAAPNKVSVIEECNKAIKGISRIRKRTRGW